MIRQDLNGDGIIIIDGQNVETVYYWLTVVSEAGPVVAEGSISGSERVMRKIKNAKVAIWTAPQLRYNATVVETGRAGCDAGIIVNAAKSR